MGYLLKPATLLIVLPVLISGFARTAPVSQTGLPPPAAPRPLTLEPSQRDGLSNEQIATLKSLQLVSDYPLYVMHYGGAYRLEAQLDASARPAHPAREKAFPITGRLPAAEAPGWGCSLFAALSSGANRYYGRNFDWQYSPALLLFTDPPDGYASVSMVDIDYLIPAKLRGKVGELAALPLDDRQFLLGAPEIPFDGMNEHGLVVGMAAVFESRVPYDPRKPDIGSLGVIREMLDHARDVEQAIAILQGYNITMEGGPPLHYLIADRSGRAALVEFYDELVVIRNGSPWHVATNHLRATADPNGPSGCWRYDRVEERLSAVIGQLDAQQSLDLLRSVSQSGEYPTQWSIVYGIDTGEIRVVMGREFDSTNFFRLALKED